jgi:hypothetical protein
VKKGVDIVGAQGLFAELGQRGDLPSQLRDFLRYGWHR